MEAMPEAAARVPDAPAAPARGGGAVSGRRRGIGLVGDVALVIGAVLLVSAALLYGGLQLLGYRFYEVSSDSMAPELNRGDVVTAHRVDGHDVKVGDVIVFRREGFSDPIVHRVVRIKSDPDIQSILKDKDGKVIRTEWAYAPRTFWTQGDANNTEDQQPVDESALLGEERFTVPWPLNLLATSVDRTLLIIVGVTAIGAYVVWELFDMSRGLARRRRNKTAPPGEQRS